LKITAYTLLFCAPEETTAVNSKARNYQEKMLEYLGDARTLYLSLAEVGVPLVLLTNRAGELRNLMPWPEGTMPEIREISFEGEIPRNIFFYSAHRKWDVYRYLGGLEEDAYVMLLDLDVIVGKGFSESFRFCAEQGISLVYDITDQVVPAYGSARILADLQAISPFYGSVRWYGGEYISGRPAFFWEMYKTVEIFKAAYFEKAPILLHNGDEFVSTMAIESLKKDGWRVDDGGTLGVIGRYWSTRCRHIQRSFAHYADFCSLLHLPADKSFLAKVSPCSNNERLTLYQRYLLKRLPVEWVKESAKRFLRIRPSRRRGQVQPSQRRAFSSGPGLKGL
jgi:hypothetical protein